MRKISEDAVWTWIMLHTILLLRKDFFSFPQHPYKYSVVICLTHNFF